MNLKSQSELSIAPAKTISAEAPHELSLLRIFQRPSAGATVRLCAVGDIGLSGRAAATVKSCGSDILFAEVAPILRDADIVFGNLETPLASDIAPGNMFAAPITGAAILREAGFKVLHLANNHVGEYGQPGLAVTLAAVRKAGLLPLGAGDDAAAARQLIRTDINNLRIGWLGCGRTLLPQVQAGPQYWEFNEQELVAAIAQARSEVDVLIVSIHIGLMFLDYPHPNHKAMAEQLMEAGADVILMHHAHVLQGVEITAAGRACCYNLGNFLYDYREVNVLTGVMLDEQQEGAVFVLDLDMRGVASLAALPTWIDSNCCVRWAVKERGENILQRLRRITLGLATNYHREFDRQRVERNFGDILRVTMFHARRGNWAFVFDALLRTRPEHLGQLIRYTFRRFARVGR
jgi:Bacterial capsule synthesis protein PGA_cap